MPSSMSSGLDDKIKAMSTFAGLEQNTCERYLEESGGDYEGGKSTFLARGFTKTRARCTRTHTAAIQTHKLTILPPPHPPLHLQHACVRTKTVCRISASTPSPASPTARRRTGGTALRLRRRPRRRRRPGAKRTEGRKSASPSWTRTTCTWLRYSAAFFRCPFSPAQRSEGVRRCRARSTTPNLPFRYSPMFRVSCFTPPLPEQAGHRRPQHAVGNTAGWAGYQTYRGQATECGARCGRPRPQDQRQGHRRQR